MGFSPIETMWVISRRFKEEMETIPLVYEFRNQTWLKDGTFQFLEKNGVGYCVVDEPKIPKLMPYLPRATSDIGYFRFHGRNPNWFNVPIKVRYDYLYTEEELKGLSLDIQEISRRQPRPWFFLTTAIQALRPRMRPRWPNLLLEQKNSSES